MLTKGKITTLLSALAICGAASGNLAVDAQNAQKIGVVELKTVLDKYPKVKELEENLKAEEDRLHKMIERSNKDFQVAKKNKKSDAELKALQKELQGKIDQEVNNYQKKLLAKDKMLKDELFAAIKAEAKAKNLDTVLEKSVILVGGTDITDAVVQRIAQSYEKSDSKATK
ncbi:MAG TPA: OmpH family outer membrane protein [Candidatus Melainabacteria bacterium]|nr:OmpH family outer membrane protein [Candidatus Melainabacteria bacterium]